MNDYSGPNRRGTSSDTIMLLGEIQKIAVIAAQTQTSVELLRVDFSEVKKNTASCEDLDRVEKNFTAHIDEHKETKNQASDTKKWAIGTIIAAGIGALSFLGSLVQNPSSLPK